MWRQFQSISMLWPSMGCCVRNYYYTKCMMVWQAAGLCGFQITTQIRGDVVIRRCRICLTHIVRIPWRVRMGATCSFYVLLTPDCIPYYANRIVTRNSDIIHSIPKFPITCYFNMKNPFSILNLPQTLA